MAHKEVLKQLQTKKNVHNRYKAYVEFGVDEELQQLYDKNNMTPYLGSDDFRAWAYSQHVTNEDAITEYAKFTFRPEMDEIINRVADTFNVTTEFILIGRRGSKNIPRWVAMYLCQEKGGHRLVDIAKKFGLKRTGSIPTTLGKLKELIHLDKELKDKINSSI